jgi:radical SAM protein with 4Fe4S-binding SPASM domain
MLKAVHSFLKDWQWSLIQDLEAGLHELHYLFWESTRRCNLNCRHCGSDCGRDDRQTGLQKATVKRLVEKIARDFDPEKIMFVVTGGEPLVRPDLIDILHHAREQGFRLGMVTNGISLDREMARRLAAVEMESVVVSLDGPEDCHDWLRNRRGAFRRACRAIVSLRRQGVPIVEAITCVTPRSLDRLGETYEIVRKLGGTHWRVFNIFPAGRAKNDRSLVLDAEGIRRLVRSMARLREKGHQQGLVVNLSEEGYLGWNWEGRVRDTPYFCRAGINIAGIMADGSIAACPNLPPWMHQGNIARDDFTEVWQHRYDAFRDRSWTRQNMCADCPQWKVCRGNSLHLWNPETNQPYWCHYKILNEPKR